MAAKAKKKILRMININTEEVSIVDAGANGHKKWLLIKADDQNSEVSKPAGGRVPPTDQAGKWIIQTLIFDKKSFNAAQAKAWVGSHEGFGDHGADETSTSYRYRQYDPSYFTEFRSQALPGATGVTAVYGHVKTNMGKTVPADDAPAEEKRKAQEARGKQYGIEVLEGSKANLSFPTGDPTTESLYADPVNLHYPLGRSENKSDPELIKNAIARFKQNHATYSQASSKARIYERIVRAALSQKIEVSYDTNNEIDKLLPADLKTRLQQKQEKSSPQPEPETPPADGTDSSQTQKGATPETHLVPGAWLSDLVKEADALEAWASAMSAVESVSGVVEQGAGNGGQPNEVGKVAMLKADLDREQKLAKRLTEENDSLKAELKKERATIHQLKQRIGTSRSHVPSDLIGKRGSQEDPMEKISPLVDMSPPLNSGG